MTGGRWNHEPHMRYVCHQCLRIVEFDEVAHRDIYSDLCWIQCDQCARTYGQVCGIDRVRNPRPHGYAECPFMGDAERQNRGRLVALRDPLPAGEPHSGEGA